MPRNKATPDIAEFIAPLNMNGLQGRMLVAPPSGNRKRELLLVTGHHTQLEQWWGLINALQDYGNVTVPDLPGFGGMDSFYKINKPPTIDNFADYLAAFVRLRYKRRRLMIVGVSFGFVVATRMLQRYPDLAKRTDLVVNMAGLMHRDDFALKPAKRQVLRSLTRLLAVRPVAFAVKYLLLNEPVVKAIHSHITPSKHLWLSLDPLGANDQARLGSRAWWVNDCSTHWRTISQCLALDNCQQRVELPVWSVTIKDDRLFDAAIIEQHILVVFTSSKTVLVDVASADLTSKASAMLLLPKSLGKALAA